MQVWRKIFRYAFPPRRFPSINRFQLNFRWREWKQSNRSLIVISNKRRCVFMLSKYADGRKFALFRRRRHSWTLANERREWRNKSNQFVLCILIAIHSHRIEKFSWDFDQGFHIFCRPFKKVKYLKQFSLGQIFSNKFLVYSNCHEHSLAQLTNTKFTKILPVTIFNMKNFPLHTLSQIMSYLSRKGLYI